MAGNRTVRLGSICSKIGSGATPRGGKDAYKGGATSLIRSQNIYNTGFHRNGLAFIDDAQAEELSNVEVQPDDVLLNITGDSVARCCQVALDVLPARVNQHVAIIRPRAAEADARFLRYVLVSESMQDRLLALASAGATRNALTKVMIEALEISMPSLSEQRAIASILGALDDKIELNRRMNATLEAMARALFQSWFVDFDPVRAKSEGRAPAAMDAETAALFPSEFIDSELGLIPKGWSATTLGSCIGFQSGFSFKSQDWKESGIPVVKIGSVKPGIIDLSQVSYVDNQIAQKAARYRLTTGDMLIGMTGYVGEVGLVPPSDNPPLLNQRVGKFVMAKPGTESLAFWYCSTRQPEFKAFVEERSHGTAQANVSGESIMEFPLVVPNLGLLDAFNRTCQPLLERILLNHKQSRTHAALRDTLLPRLLGGELSVGEGQLSGDPH